MDHDYRLYRSRRPVAVAFRAQDLATGGSSNTHGHTAIVFTLPLLFLTTVIFIVDSRICVGKCLGRELSSDRYFVCAGGSSRTHGQTAMVLTLPFVFLMTVIFMIGRSDYRRLSTTTSTSQGRRVPFLAGVVVFLPFIAVVSFDW